MTDEASDLKGDFSALKNDPRSPEDHALATRHAPLIRFDSREPFLPSVVGYTVFREDGSSPSFPRQIALPPGVTQVIEYAIWWDWDIEHLYELEHIWVHLDAAEKVVGGEASWHGNYNAMADENGQPPLAKGRLVVHSEPGKHAFAPSPQWLIERKPTTFMSCSRTAGKMGVHVTPLFQDVIHDRTPMNNQLVHTYLERQTFEPSYQFSKSFDLKDATFVPWDHLYKWIPTRVTWWTKELARTIPPHERRGLRIAHRGASAHAQENSAESMRKALELGADMVEIDIRTTEDGLPVVAHDASLKRLYEVDVLISELTLEELQTHTSHNPILTFDEAVTLCLDLRLGLYLDIKALNERAATSMMETLDKYNFVKRTIFGSFRPDYLAEIKAHRPDAVTSILFNSTNVDPVLLARSIQADYVHPCWESRSDEPHRLLTPEWIERVRAAELGIICWHEERPSEIRALQALGVDGICSDRPELLIPANARRFLSEEAV